MSTAIAQLETLLLPPDRWPMIAPVMRGVFQNSMPVTPAQSAFLAALDGEDLAGFVHVEKVFHFNCLYVAPQYRRTRLAWQLIGEANSLMPRGHSALIIAEKLPVIRALSRFGVRDLGTQRIFRKDF